MLTIIAAISDCLLWVVTNVLSCFMVYFGLISYLAPEYWNASNDPILPIGILKTSLESNDFDPVTSLFFHGEGAMKLAVGIVGLWTSKRAAARGYARSWRQVQRFNACLFLALLLPAIPVWYLNTRQELVDEGYYDPSRYYESMRTTGAISAVLVLGLLGSYLFDKNENEVPKAKPSTPIERAAVGVIANGVLFGMMLLLVPQRMFAPGGWLPWFLHTTNPADGRRFDPVMLYGARMLGTTHVPLLVSVAYHSSVPWLSYRFMMMNLLLFLPLDVLTAMDDSTTTEEGDDGSSGQGQVFVFNRLFWAVLTAIHAICLAIVYQASSKLSPQTEAVAAGKKKQQ